MCMRIKILMFFKVYLLNMNIGMLFSCSLVCDCYFVGFIVISWGVVWYSVSWICCGISLFIFG